VTTYGVGGFGLFARALGEHFVLETALGDTDACFLGIFGEELLAFCLGCLTCFCLGCILLLFELLEESVDNLLSFLMTDFERVVVEHIGDGRCEIFYFEVVFESHLFELLTNSETERIT